MEPFGKLGGVPADEADDGGIRAGGHKKTPEKSIILVKKPGRGEHGQDGTRRQAREVMGTRRRTKKISPLMDSAQGKGQQTGKYKGYL